MRLALGTSATNRMLVAHPPSVPSAHCLSAAKSVGFSLRTHRITHTPRRPALQIRSAYGAEKKHNPQHRKYCANIYFKISFTCQRQAATGEKGKRVTRNWRKGKTREKGKLSQVRCTIFLFVFTYIFFIGHGSLSTQFDLISFRFIYL